MINWFKNNFMWIRFDSTFGMINYIKIFRVVAVFQWVKASYDASLMDAFKYLKK